MVFPSIGNHLSRDFVLGNISRINIYFGMIASRKRLRKSLRETNKEVVMRTWLLSIRQEREKERVVERRVTMMKVHHNEARRRT